MAISTNQKPTIYRNLYENTGPALQSQKAVSMQLLPLGFVEQNTNILSKYYFI